MSQPDFSELARDIQQVLFTEEQIQARIAELGARIAEDYHDKQPVLVGALKGVMFFMADLLRHIPIPLEVDFIAIASYSPELRDRGVVRLIKDLGIPISGRHVIFVEDVVDTGLTMNYLLNHLRARQPASLEVCALFDKPKRRLIDLPIRYKGFELPDRYAVGYGLDFREKYRNLPFVGLLKADIFQGR